MSNEKTQTSFKYSAPLRPSIAATVAYGFESFQHCVDTYSGKVQSHAYSRLSNPSVEALENAYSLRSRALKTVGFASGMAAISAVCMAICRPGKNIVVSPKLYGGTVAFFKSLQEFNVDIRYLDFSNPVELEKSIDSNTVLIFSEPISNPTMEWYDYSCIYEIAKKNKILCCLDNTNTTALFDALSYCDLEIVSATKYIGGHGAGIGGLVACGAFNLEGERYQYLNKPSGDFAGKSPTAFGSYAIPQILRASQLRNFGACMSPFNAYLFSIGLDTLDLRMRDISQKTLSLAKLCLENTSIDCVFHAEIGDKSEGISKYFPRGSGGLFSFSLKGGYQNVERFFSSLKTIPIATNIGDSKTIVQHVETTSHSQLSKEQLSAAGIPNNLLRVSVGLESIDILVEEFKQALSSLNA